MSKQNAAEGRTVEQRKILRVERDGARETTDPVIREAPLTVYLNGREFVTLLCTPELMDMLAVGFLRSEGLIREFSEVTSLRLDEEQGFVFIETQGGSLAEKLYGKRTITSGCGKGTVFFSVLDALTSERITSGVTVTVAQIHGLMHALQERALLFQLTGGIHSAALCTPEGVVYFCEDIGRHNAVDKILGLCLRDGVTISDKILVTSGRISSEILVKSAKLGLSMLVSRAAPTTLSVDLAEKIGITLVGFARGQRLNVYSHAERVVY
jgi:FdhD protein